MSVLSLSLEAVGLLGCTWWLLGRYRAPDASLAIVTVVFVSWVLSFLGLVLLPIDMAQNGGHPSTNLTLNDSSDDVDAMNANKTFLGVWQALYWTTFVMSWCLLPFLVEFCQNGEFELKARLRSSLRKHLFHWTIIVAVTIAVVVYLLVFGRFTVQGVLGMAMATANTYGLLWLIVLLGYGLVDIPRSLWTLRYPEVRLRALCFHAVHVHNERMEAIFLYDDVVRDVRACHERMLHAESASIILTADMQEVKTHLGIIRSLFHSESSHAQATEAGHSKVSPLQSHFSSMGSRSPMLSMATLSTATAPTHREVVDLHRRMKMAQEDLRGTEQAWLEICRQAEALQRQVKPADHRALPPAGLYSTTNMLGQLQSVVQMTHHQLQRLVLPPLWTLGAIVTGLGSVCILWGELTMAWGADVSLFSLLSRWLNVQPDASRTEVVVLALLVYMITCAYSSLFKLRSFGRFVLRSHGHSSELALLKCSIYQCRLQFALSYNFLLLLHQPQLTSTTAFHQLWSHMHVLRIVGHDFSIYAPFLMVVLVVCTITNVYARVIKSLVSMEQYEQWIPGDVDHEAQINRGHTLILKGLEKQRREQGRNKQKEWSGVTFTTENRVIAESLLSQEEEEE